MTKHKRLLKKGSKYFRRITGMRREVFSKLIEILRAALVKKHAKGGRKPELSVEYILLAALEYWREYRTYAAIGADFDLDESNIFRWVKWCEEALMGSNQITLPGKKALFSGHYEVIQIDATESPIERPKRGQRKYYSGKKKRHTMKSQIVVDKATKRLFVSKRVKGNGMISSFSRIPNCPSIRTQQQKLTADIKESKKFTTTPSTRRESLKRET